MRTFLLGCIVALLAGCFAEEPSTYATRLVKDLEAQMDAGTAFLKIDRSKTEDVVKLMGRSADHMSRGSGELRYLRFVLPPDGSQVVFAMKPSAGGGLVLDHFRAEKKDWTP